MLLWTPFCFVQKFSIWLVFNVGETMHNQIHYVIANEYFLEI